MTYRLSTAVLLVGAVLAPLAAQEPNQATRVSSFTVRVHEIESATRGLVVVGRDGIVQAITVAPDVALYDELAVGDVIVVDYIDAVVVALKPRASLTIVEDTTAAAQAGAADPGIKVEQQMKQVVTIDRVDPAARTVVYHGKDNRRVLRAVQDLELVRGLKAGDVVEITMTRARAVRVQRASP